MNPTRFSIYRKSSFVFRQGTCWFSSPRCWTEMSRRWRGGIWDGNFCQDEFFFFFSKWYGAKPQRANPSDNWTRQVFLTGAVHLLLTQRKGKAERKDRWKVALSNGL